MGGGSLVLHAGLAAKPSRLRTVGGGSQRTRWPDLAPQGIEGGDHPDARRGGGAERARWRHGRRHADRHVGGTDVAGLARRLCQKAVLRRLRPHGEHRVVVDDADRDLTGTRGRLRPHRDAGLDGQAAHPATSGEPRVCPAADIADPHRHLDGDASSAPFAVVRGRHAQLAAARGTRSMAAPMRSTKLSQ